MRRLVTGVLAAAALVGGVATAGGGSRAAAQAGGPAVAGVVEGPFREDRAAFDGTRFGADELSDAGCTTAPDGTKHCHPASVSGAVLADGRILYWDGLAGQENAQISPALEYGAVQVNDLSRVMSLGATPADTTWAQPDPADGGANADGRTDSDVGSPQQDRRSAGDMFCAGQVQLADGRVLVVGGSHYYSEPALTDRYGVVEVEGLKNSRVFDPAGNTWSQTGSMSFQRWYPTLVTLSDGRVMAASGTTKLIKPVYTDEKNRSNTGTNVKQTEVYEPATGRWSVMADGERTLPLYPRLHLLPNGRVYFDSAGQTFNPAGEAVDEGLWNLAAVFDPGAPAGRAKWRDIGVPGLGTVSEPGFRGSTFSVMLPLKASSWGTYPTASFLSAGGTVGTSPGSYLPTVTSRINTVDVGGGVEQLATTVTGPLNEPRWYGSAVSLPDGSILALSGASDDEVIQPGAGLPVRSMELFTPTVRAQTAGDGSSVSGYAGGTWRKVANGIRGRTYHNLAALLPDGRVLIGGHAPLPNGYGFPRTTPGGFSNGFRDASFEIYSPPYLFWGPRPRITAVDQALRTGQAVVITTPDAADTETVVLVRNTAITHLVDGDQRTVELRITGRNDNTVTAALPDDRAVLPAGPYMLFTTKSADRGLIPSVARQVFVDAVVPAWASRVAPGGGGTGAGIPARPDRSAPSPNLPATGGAGPVVAGVAAFGWGLALRRLTRRGRPAAGGLSG